MGASDRMDLVIRPAAPSEADSLQRLARASKGYWGYSQAFMRKWDYEAEITGSFIASRGVFCADANASLAGSYALSFENESSQLEHLWVEPAFIGRGVGSRLLDHALAQACAAGASVLVVHADPNAVGFYERMGARRAGEVRDPRLDLTFPVLELRVGAGLPR